MHDNRMHKVLSLNGERESFKPKLLDKTGRECGELRVPHCDW